MDHTNDNHYVFFVSVVQDNIIIYIILIKQPLARGSTCTLNWPMQEHDKQEKTKNSLFFLFKRNQTEDIDHA